MRTAANRKLADFLAEVWQMLTFCRQVIGMILISRDYDFWTVLDVDASYSLDTNHFLHHLFWHNELIYFLSQTTLIY